MNGEPKRSAIGDQRSAMPKLSALSSQLSARARRGVPAHLDSSRHGESPRATFIPHPSALRRAFTLTELLVSLVILVGMMTLIAMIFSTAGKSSGVAQAQARLHRQLLQAADTMRIDLANTLTGTSAAGAPQGVLAIAGVAIDAADTPKSLVRPHRADVLMLITQQRFEPFIYDLSHNTVLDELKQVVYGHADIGKIDASTGQWFPTVKYVETRDPLRPGGSDMFASEWHLARRVVGFAKEPPAGVGWAPWDGRSGLASPAFLEGQADVMFDPGIYSTPGLGSFSSVLATIMPGHYAYTRQSSGQMQPRYFYFEDTTKGQKFYWDSTYYLLTAKGSGEAPIESYDPHAYWWQFVRLVGPKLTHWQRTAGSSLKEIAAREVSTWPPLDGGYRVPANAGIPRVCYYWPRWFYYPAGVAGPTDSYRTRIDPMPPPGMPARTAAYFMPSCSEFKVEFTYDDPREIVVDPATGQPVLVDLNDDGTFDAPAASPVNWQTVPPGEIYVWKGLSTDPDVYPPVAGDDDHRNRTFPFRWPRALRITIRAYAPGGALDYPIEHSLVHVWK